MDIETPLTVLESPAFTHACKKLSEDEYDDIILFLATKPEAGDIIPGTGGVRKVRWANESQGKGKRGGYRIIYYLHSLDIPLIALNIFTKNFKTDLTKAEENVFKKTISPMVKKLYEMEGTRHE